MDGERWNAVVIDEFRQSSDELRWKEVEVDTEGVGGGTMLGFLTVIFGFGFGF